MNQYLPFEGVDPVNTAVSIAYHNPLYVADAVLPRVQVGRQEFRHLIYPIEETLRLPDTLVGRRGRVNEVSLTGKEVVNICSDYAIEDAIPAADALNAIDAGLVSPVGHSVVTLSDYIMLDREVRAAALVFDPAQYGAANKLQLAGDDQWSAAHADSDPLEDLIAGIDACLLRPTHLLVGSATWMKLRMHPRIVAAIHGNAGDTGVVMREQVARLFELEAVLVGEQRLNTARFRQLATLERVWGKHALLFHHNANADTRQGLTFGYTAEWTHRQVMTFEDRKIGARGGTRVRVLESVKEVIAAPMAAFFIQDAVA